MANYLGIIYLTPVRFMAIFCPETKGYSVMTKLEATNEAVRQSQASGGERRYAVKWDRPDGEHWTVETRKPGLAGVCLLVVDGKLEHA